MASGVTSAAFRAIAHRDAATQARREWRICPVILFAPYAFTPHGPGATVAAAYSQACDNGFMQAGDPPNRAVILIPMFNDWDAADLLLAELDGVLGGYAMSPEVVLIDDSSTQPMPPGFASRNFTALGSVNILRLRRNLGHQRAIAAGLVYIYEN